MNVVNAEKQHEIHHLCRRYHVRSLELFGTAARGDFSKGKSDLDFLVVFEPCAPNEHYERYFGLLEDLEALFKFPVDLLEMNIIPNPFLLRRIQEDRIPIYAA